MLEITDSNVAPQQRSTRAQRPAAAPLGGSRKCACELPPLLSFSHGSGASVRDHRRYRCGLARLRALAPPGSANVYYITSSIGIAYNNKHDG